MTELNEPIKGDLVSADQQAELVRRARRKFSGPGVIETLDGFYFKSPRTKRGGQTRILEIAENAGDFADHLVCRVIGSDPDEYTPILVAKPWFLRKTLWNSTGPDDPEGPVRGEVRYVYDVTDSTKRTAYDVNDPPGTLEAERNKRTEIVLPEYLIGDEILAVGAKVDIVVIVEEVPVIVTVNLLALTEGRGWTVVYEQL